MEPAQTIRVLLVDDIPEVRENLRKLLYFERDIEVVGVATNGEEAIAQARELAPDVVLMDINMPGMDGIAASEAISAQLPRIQIIMMSVQGETDYLRRSMLAGAKGFLIKPFGSDEMSATIRNVYSLAPKSAPPPPAQVHYGTQTRVPVQAISRPRDQGSIIAVYSPKGGVGCSLLATNLAIALRGLADDKTVLVDCSLQFGDAGVLLNISSSHTIVELANKLGQMDSDLLEGILSPHLSGVQVLLAPSRPEEADLITADHVREALEVLRGICTYVIVDMSSALQDVALTVFDLADRIFLVATPDIPSVKSARLFFDVTDALSYPEEKIRLILNQTDRQNTIGPKEIATGIKHPVYLAIPLDRRSAYAAINQGTPCVLNNRTSPIAQSAIRLAQMLAQELAPVQVVAGKRASDKPGGFLSRLLRK